MVPFKVRRRAQAVRLAAQGRTAPRIARRLGLDRTNLHQHLGAAEIFSLSWIPHRQLPNTSGVVSAMVSTQLLGFLIGSFQTV